jgi:hypothetical protein
VHSPTDLAQKSRARAQLLAQVPTAMARAKRKKTLAEENKNQLDLPPQQTTDPAPAVAAPTPETPAPVGMEGPSSPAGAIEELPVPEPVRPQKPPGRRRPAKCAVDPDAAPNAEGSAAVGVTVPVKPEAAKVRPPMTRVMENIVRLRVLGHVLSTSDGEVKYKVEGGPLSAEAAAEAANIIAELQQKKDEAYQFLYDMYSPSTRFCRKPRCGKPAKYPDIDLCQDHLGIWA